jgi:hypothetical protein
MFIPLFKLISSAEGTRIEALRRVEVGGLFPPRWEGAKTLLQKNFDSSVWKCCILVDSEMLNV